MIKSLRAQYFVGGIITLMLMLALLLWNAKLQIDAALEARFHAELDLAGPLLGAAIAPLLTARDPASVQEVLTEAATAQHLAFVEVRDARGRPVARSGIRPEQHGHLRSRTMALEMAGQRLGELDFGIDASALDVARAGLLRNSLLIGAGVLLAGLGLLALWSAWVGANLKRLAEASQRVAAGDYAQQLPASRVQELGLVAASFNRMSAAIRDKMAALLESEQHQRSLVASMSGGLLVYDADGRVLDGNEAALRLLGLPSLEQLPPGTDPLALHLSGDSRRLADALPAARALRTGQPQREVLLQCQPPGQALRWLSVNAEPRRPGGVVCTLNDVTRHVQGEQALRTLNEGLESRVQQRTAELQAARDEAERANLAKSQFLSRMSHELRTPLNAILGFAQLLALGGERLRAAEADKIAQIERAGWHLLDLINDVLDLSRIEAGEMATLMEPVDVVELVSETAQMLASLASQQAVRLQLQGPPQAWALADRKRLKQVLNNLLSNALKYNRRGGRVTVQVGAADRRLVVSVSDTGRGMTAEQLAGLYRPFVRFERHEDTTPGTGIGLVITKRLVELMGGRIEARSQPDEGSVFEIDLQACAAPDATGLLPRQQLQATAAELLRRRRLVYVEDNQANAEMLRSMLRQRPNYELRIAPDGLSGLAMLRAERPDLALIDIALPDIDGVELCRRVRADPQLAGLPMLAFSANAMPAEIERALQAGFDSYLTKPIDLHRLLGAVEQVLASKA